MSVFGGAGHRLWWSGGAVALGGCPATPPGSFFCLTCSLARARLPATRHCTLYGVEVGHRLTPMTPECGYVRRGHPKPSLALRAGVHALSPTVATPHTPPITESGCEPRRDSQRRGLELGRSSRPVRLTRGGSGMAGGAGAGGAAGTGTAGAAAAPAGAAAPPAACALRAAADIRPRCRAPRSLSAGMGIDRWRACQCEIASGQPGSLIKNSWASHAFHDASYPFHLI
eukprot:320456-Rhodomonas_salina.3